MQVSAGTPAIYGKVSHSNQVVYMLSYHINTWADDSVLSVECQSSACKDEVACDLLCKQGYRGSSNGLLEHLASVQRWRAEDVGRSVLM